ncbi:hypothetical protein [Flavobacterium sp. MK4S-17]|uniref:hypothetical protein n=1 Tax=Flavobacterium sp. MK4S-17 TaxID=2543737 RepID=UPI001F3ACF76|nr:hypothetical protein [Flavobacterium sp. MK4S-17]
MKNFLPIFLLMIIGLPLQAQNLYLQIEGRTTAETGIIDSVSYKRKHENAKSISQEVQQLSAALFKTGYLENRETAHLKINDSTFAYRFSVGNKTADIHIYTGLLRNRDKELLSIANDTIILPIVEVENYMQGTVAALERKGYSLSSAQLVNYRKYKNRLYADLTLKIENRRILDDIILEGYTKFPEGVKRSTLRQYKGKTFNRETLQKINNDFKNLRFVNQLRYPEILFKEDTTKVYVYIKKARTNSFDGFIGFSNDEDENRLRFNGYVDLALNNVLNTGEKFNLNWKNNGDEQTTFNIGAELPYIFRSPVGLKASLMIFKQDSTFQNTVTDLNLGYYFSYNSKLYLGFRQTQSVDIQDLNNSLLSDFDNTFWTSTYEYSRYNVDDFLFPEKTTLLFKGGLGNRQSKSGGKEDQYFMQYDVAHNLYLNQRNIINIKSEAFYLSSNTYIVNELYRFGGINSIRGFNENSLQASLYGALMAEYRYVLAPNMYVHSITDYGYFQDKTTGLKDNLLGLGFGFGLLTKTGLFNIVYANGSTKDQSIKLSNSIVHLSFRATF